MAERKRSSYRVVVAGAAYTDPTTVTDAAGNRAEVGLRKDAYNGDVIDLTPVEATRLLALGAVVDADAPETYAEMKVDDLKALADERGLTVDGNGTEGRVLKEDYVLALTAADEAA